MHDTKSHPQRCQRSAQSENSIDRRYPNPSNIRKTWVGKPTPRHAYVVSPPQNKVLCFVSERFDKLPTYSETLIAPGCQNNWSFFTRQRHGGSLNQWPIHGAFPGLEAVVSDDKTCSLLHQAHASNILVAG